MSVPSSTLERGESEDLPPAEITSAPPAKWELPVNFEMFQTFIDHGCLLDPQDYPIYPNGNTTFVKASTETVTNFGTVGFTKTTGKEKRSKGTWEILWVYCLGAVVCDLEACQWVGSPPTGRGAVVAYLETNPKCPGAAGQCPGKVLWTVCDGTALRFDFHIPTSWGLLQHQGIHQHAWPEAKKPDKLARETLKAEIVKNPAVGAFKLKMGKAISLDDPITNVTDIHGSFINTDCLRYYRRIVLRELNIVPDKLGAGVGDKFIMDMFQWCRHGLLVISAGFQEENEHFTFQSKWMADRLLARDENNEKSFQMKCMDLLEPAEEGGLDHEEKLDKIRRLFPKAKRWLDWWTMSDVQSMLFPSRRRMLDNYPDGDNGLPDTTNALESMHWVYYMISSGKKCLMVGMVELYAYVNVLEEEYHTVMCGISVEYGSQSKMQVNVTQSIGWAKPTKRKFINDGRPPDTTAGLLEGPEPVGRKKNLGRPKNSVNIDHNPYTTYQSYTQSEEEHRTNRCWMSAAMESLFALYNPLWLRNATGKGSTLFHQLVTHFGSRTTYHLTKLGRIRTVLTNGQSKLFKFCNEKQQANFQPGHFASCDFFLELLLDPKRNPTKALAGLFELVENRVFSCDSATSTSPCLAPQTRSLTTITIHKSMFDENLLEYGQVQELINLWTSTGLPKWPGLACKCQSTATNTVPKSQPKSIPKIGRKALAKRQESVTVVPLTEFVPQVTKYVRENTRLAFKDDLAPQHLYFFNEVASLTDQTIRDWYMASLNWPSTLLVHGYSYTLFSRGFWTNNHYWCKVVRSGEGGATGVWLHDEARNEGIARLVNKDTSSIGGCQPGTSWVFYSRRWTPSEEQYVRDSISKITHDHPNAKGDTPFIHLGILINATPVVVEEASSMEPLPAPVSELIPRPSKHRSVNSTSPMDSMDNTTPEHP
ncbi:hypothetical protein MJO29_006420 [Puccinia striiformis f. sp. tritici]|nr:hypothetical protein MJO29_006420 [Puccinia striiformis f. sp. tritici]